MLNLNISNVKKTWNLFVNFIAHQLVRNIFIYTTSNIFRAALPFLLLPLLTRYLTPADYGIVATFEVLVALFTVLIGINAHGAVGINYFKMDKERLSVYIGNVVFLVTINMVIVGVLMWSVKAPLSFMIHFPQDWLLRIVFIAFSGFMILLVLSFWQVQQKSFLYSIFQNSQVIMNLILTLYFVVALKWQWEGRLWGISISYFIFAIIGWIVLIRQQYVKFILKKEYIKDILMFGIPILPHALGGWIILATDRFFLNAMVGLSATGLYAVGYQIGAIVGLLGQAFNNAFAPFLFTKLTEDSSINKLKLVKLTYLFFVGIVIITLIIIYLAPLLLRVLVPSDFAAAGEYIKWIALAGCCNWMYYLVANYIFFVKKTYFLAITTLLAAILNVVLNYVLIRQNGPIGAAQATAVAYFVTFIFTWFLSAHVYKMPWNLKI